MSYCDGVRGDGIRDEESEERKERGGQGREKVKIKNQRRGKLEEDKK